MAKDLGAISELAFMLEATKRGYLVSIPHNELHYDFVVDGHQGLHRVQVKSCHSQMTDCYHLGTSYGSTVKKGYSALEVDVMAVHIMAEGLWYLIPVYELRARKSIRIFPGKNDHEFSKFKERWIF